MIIEETPAPEGSKLQSLQLNNNDITVRSQLNSYKDATIRSQSNISEAVGARRDSIEPYSDHSDTLM